jgi:glycosyltransferase involved in cell wall biosynthesis
VIRLFLNGLGASAGAGLTYLFNVLPHLSATPGVRATLAVQAKLRGEFRRIPNLTLLEADVPSSTAARFWFEQRSLPQLIRNSGADVLISCGNFALRKSPIPQILLSGNSLYTSSDFDRDLWHRREFGMWLDTRIRSAFAKRSVHWADCTVAPSQAFADELRRWTGRNVRAIYHGFDHELFFRDQSQLPDHVQCKLLDAKDSLKLLFVSHYNYYRNFETLFQALPLITQKLKPRKVRLFLTSKLQDDANPGTYRTQRASALIQQLGIRSEVVELEAIQYRSLHHMYRACDIYVTPAYTETFAHPLVEAMAGGLPVVASDLAVHREVTAGAGLYFPRFSPEALAQNLARVATTPDLAARLAVAGRQRATHFSWKRHVEKLLKLAFSITGTPASRVATSAA